MVAYLAYSPFYPLYPFLKHSGALKVRVRSVGRQQGPKSTLLQRPVGWHLHGGGCLQVTRKPLLHHWGCCPCPCLQISEHWYFESFTIKLKFNLLHETRNLIIFSKPFKEMMEEPQEGKGRKESECSA